MKKALILGLALCALAFGQMGGSGVQNGNPASLTFTIANGASLSAGVDMKGCTPARILINPAGTGSAAWTTANLTFQGSEDGSVYGNVHDEFGTEVGVTVPTGADAAMKMIVVSPSAWWSWRYLKVRSGTSASAVNQGAARTIKVICR